MAVFAFGADYSGRNMFYYFASNNCVGIGKNCINYNSDLKCAFFSDKVVPMGSFTIEA